MKSYATQSAVNISCILFKYVKGFDHLQNDPLLQNQTRWMIPHHKTKFHPLRASTIDEASTEGNLNVHNDVYLVQFQQSPGDLNQMAIHNETTLGTPGHFPVSLRNVSPCHEFDIGATRNSPWYGQSSWQLDTLLCHP